MLRRRSLARTAARTAVVAGTATAVSGNVARRQAARHAPAEPAPAPAPEPPPAAPSPAPAADPLDQRLPAARVEATGVDGGRVPAAQADLAIESIAGHTRNVVDDGAAATDQPNASPVGGGESVRSAFVLSAEPPR